jgi:hypothetical protein
MSQKIRVLATVIVLLHTLAGCSDRIPVAPLTPLSDAGATATSGWSEDETLLVRTKPLVADEQISAWVYPSSNKYQSVKLRDAGLKVSFPPGSVSAPLYVTLIAHKGPYVTYEFLPHGTTFAVPVKVQQELKGTTAYHNDVVMSALRAGYLANGLADVDYETGTATFSETFTIYYFDDTDTFTKTTPSVAKFYTSHFSGYAMASGRSGGSGY